MAHRTTSYSSKFIRSGGNVTFQERSVQPSDFTLERGYTYAQDWAYYEERFIQKYPFWQIFADSFVLRRSIVLISGYQKCYTRNFDASELEGHLEPGFVELKAFAVPGLDRGSIPKGKYQLKDLAFKDHGDGFTTVNVTYFQAGEWKLVELFSSHPDPVTGVIYEQQ